MFLVNREGRGALLSAAPAHGHLATVDVIFPVLHGPNGEDGTVQGLLHACGVPYVGARVMGSAIGMDKDVTKRLLLQAGLPTARCMVVHLAEHTAATFDACAKELGLPLFVKPANTGSSVGISKAHTQREFEAALEKAFRYDYKVVVEEFIDGREIECAVIGTQDPEVTVCGEITTTHEFYSYQAKYEDEAATSLTIPADIPPEIASQIRSLALKAYRVLCCSGMARIDFFLDTHGAARINEVNTIPGFTRHSMFPLLWAKSGLPFPALVEALIDDALIQHERESGLDHLER